MKFEGIGFNSEWAAIHTQAEFIEQHKHLPLSLDQLKEVHSLCKIMPSNLKDGNSKKSSKRIKKG